MMPTCLAPHCVKRCDLTSQPFCREDFALLTPDTRHAFALARGEGLVNADRGRRLFDEAVRSALEELENVKGKRTA